jgi:hypothetical protein
MDSQSPPPEVHDRQPVRQAVVPPALGSAIPTSDTNPKLNISDDAARALLAINNLQSTHAQHKEKKLPIGLLISLAAVVDNNSPANQTYNQINQDVDSCANPTTAISQC